MRQVLATFFLCAAAFAQAPGGKLAFEAVSVKPTPKGPPMMMPGYEVDDAHANIDKFPLHALITTAFGMPDDQVVQPDWTMEARFDVHAKLPAGGRKEQVPEMLRTMLEERFGLKVHHEQRTLAVYALTLAPGGPKFKETTGEDKTQPGCNGGFHKVCGQMTIENFAEMLSRSSRMASRPEAMMPGAPDRPIIDATGLTAKYDFVYEAGRVGGGRSAGGRGADSPSPDVEVITAAEALKALGLKLEPTKHAYDYLVVDHVEKAPTEN